MNYCLLCENPTAHNQEICSVCQGNNIDENNILNEILPLDLLFTMDYEGEYVI